MSASGSLSREILWGPPPAAEPFSKIKYESEAEALRSRPGEWALIIQHAAHGTAHGIANGLLAAFRPAGAYEAEARVAYRDENGRRKFNVWARYVGNDRDE